MAVKYACSLYYYEKKLFYIKICMIIAEDKKEKVERNCHTVPLSGIEMNLYSVRH